MEEGKQATGVSLVPPEEQPRTKDDDEDEKDLDRTLNRYSISMEQSPARKLSSLSYVDMPAIICTLGPVLA
jgi:hypothetical protein